MPSLASGLQRCSPCERLLGLLRPLPCWVSSPCVFLCNKGSRRMELKKLIIQDIPATLLDANTGFGGMQPSSTTWADDYRGHQAKGKLWRDHSWFTSLGAKDVASASVLGKQLYPLSYSDMFGARSHGPVDNKPSMPTQKFSWMTGICPDHAARAPGRTSDVFSPGYFQRSGSLCQMRSGTNSMQRRRWVSMDLASAQLDCLLHALGAAVSKTCSQTIQFPPCFGIAVFSMPCPVTCCGCLITFGRGLRHGSWLRATSFSSLRGV